MIVQTDFSKLTFHAYHSSERNKRETWSAWSIFQTQPFLFPVNPKEVPDYYRIVKRPMDLQSMREVNKLYQFFLRLKTQEPQKGKPL